MSDTISLYIIRDILFFSICIFFALQTFQSKFRQGKKTTYLFSIIYTVLSILIDVCYLQSFSPFKQFSITAGIFWVIISIVFAIITFTAKPLQLLFFVFAVIGIQSNINFISQSIYELNILPNIFGTKYLSFLLISIVVLLLTIPFMRYLYIHLLKKVVEMELLKNYWNWLFLLPFFYFLVCFFIIGADFHITGVSHWYVFFITLFLSICTVLSYVVSLKMLVKANESFNASIQSDIFSKMLTMQKEQYDIMSENIEKTARLNHDFRHHILAIQGFAQTEDLKGLTTYLNEYQSEYNISDSSPICSNHFIDVILRHFITRAKTNSIKVNVSVNELSNFELSNADLCTVFCNLFENAVESCEKQTTNEKFIKIKVKSISKSMLAIYTENSYSGEIKKRENVFLSTKHSGAGIGISAICFVAEKNGGSCKIKYKNGVFTTETLLLK